jgi:hypothetical protein
MHENPKLLITRFTHGSAGKFLSTILQTSPAVDHWNPVLENYKNNALFHDLNLYYVKKSFPKDHKFHMVQEPIAPYDTSLYSSSYSRGHNLTIAELKQHAIVNNDSRFLTAVKQNKFINLIMNKPLLPEFCRNSYVVTILTESTQEINWVHRTLWSKHYLENNNEIYYLPDHPEYCSLKSLDTVLKFQNPCVFSLEQKKQLIIDKIINNPTGHYYKNSTNFSTIDHGMEINNIFIPLKCFFESKEFINKIQEIFEAFEFGTLDQSLIKELHSQWLSIQLNPEDCHAVVDAECPRLG